MSIRLKLVVYTVCIVLLVGGGISLYFIFEGQRRILNTFEHESRQITSVLAGTIAGDLYFLDVSSLRHRLENARVNPVISYTYVTDLNGVVLADGTRANARRDQRLSDLFSVKVLRADGWISSIDGEFLKVGGPVFMPDRSRVGYLQVGFALQGAYQLVRETTRANLYLILFFVGIGVVLAVVLAMSLSRPLLSIMRAAKGIARGRFDTRVSLNRGDELGRLAESVNRMAGALQARDVDIKRAEEVLRRDREQFRHLVETTKAIPWEADAKTWQFTYVGPQAVTLLGYPLDQWYEKDFWATHIHPEDREYAIDFCLKSSQGCKDYEFEYRMIAADGRTAWLYDIVSVVCTNGMPETLRGFMIDITERKQAEEKFRLAVEASPSAIVMVNQDGRVVLVNAQTERLFGYACEELIGQSVEILVPQRFRGEHCTHRGGFLAAPRARPMGAGRELFGRRKDGSEFLVEIGLNPIHSDEGLFVLTAIVDITERKRAESELRHHREALAHVTRVSTLGELSASLAHELNQPLAAILSNAQAGLRFLDQGNHDLLEFREILQDIVHDDKRASAVISGLRGLARRQETQREQIDLAATVREILELLHSELLARQVQVETDFADGCAVLADKAQIQQVMLNMVMNAVEAMDGEPASQRRLQLSVSRTTTGEVRVAVRDSGMGIPAGKLDKVFDPFWTTKGQGMGMGLAVCRSIVESHRGQIWVERNVERGVTFYFNLPGLQQDGSSRLQTENVRAV